MTFDWSNPTVQGALVSAAINLVAIIFAGMAGVLGAVAGARIAASAARSEADRAREEARTTRVRDWNIRRVEETRSQLIAIADGFLAIMDKDVSLARKLLKRADEPLLANARLVGDLEALAVLARAVVRASSVLGGNIVVRNLRLALANPFREQDRAAMRDARTTILTALERQQERALRDEPLVELTAADIATIPEFSIAAETLDSVSEDG